MCPKYANEHGADSDNHLRKVAIVGVGGRMGSVIASELMATGKHTVTAITRADSASPIAEGVVHEVRIADYSSHASLVDALRGQEVLVITMNVFAPPDTQQKLVDAAIEAGVKWILPNEWGVNHSHPGFERVPVASMASRMTAMRKHIEEVGAGKTFWTGVASGFWYEFSLAGTEIRYGFDFEKRSLTLYDEGDVKINTSTWPQVGRAVAGFLSLPMLPQDENDTKPCMSTWKNRSLYVSSFFVSQRDMFESVKRVTGTSDKDWTITHEGVEERYYRGKKQMEAGQMHGFGILLYARLFFKDGVGDFQAKLDNDALRLPEEDFDAWTKVAVDMAAAGETNAVHGRAQSHSLA